MAKKLLELKDFSGGLNCALDSRDIQVNEFAQVYNVSCSQEGILKYGGGLIQHIYNLPHDNVNFQEGYGLFATSIDTTPSILDAQFESGFEEGTVVACSGTSLTLATLPTFQSLSDHNTNNFYRNMTVVIYHGNGIGESRRIVSYAYTDADPDTHIATLESAFSGAVNSSSKYKIYKWAGDNVSFGNSNNKDYIDKGGTTFPYDDIIAHDSDYENSFFLRTKASSITNNQSSSLGFVTYNPKTDVSWAAGDALDSNSTTIGNNTLLPGVKYTMSFWVKSSEKYYDYVSDVGHSDVYPFIQMYSDSVTDGTNTGLYLFQSRSEPQFLSGTEADYQYAQNITKNYVNNGDFEDGTATGGDGGQSGTYDPPTDWMAYDGWNATTNDSIVYSYATGADAYGGEGNSVKMTFGSAFAFESVNINNQGNQLIPSCYMYQDITLEDNQWYSLSFATEQNTSPGTCRPMFSILDQNNLVSTGVYADETEAAADGSVTLTVDNGSGAGSAATNALLKYQEVYKSDGTFLGVCTAVTSNTEIVFAGGTAAQITDDDLLYTARYLVVWTECSPLTTNTFQHIPYDSNVPNQFNDNNSLRTKFFVPDNSGTPTKIRLAFSARASSGQEVLFDSICIKKSFPNLESMCKINGSYVNKLLPHPRDNDITNWNKYSFNFTIPEEYNASDDWVINLNAGKKGFQDSASGNTNTNTVYFDTIQIETSNLGQDLIFLNENTSTGSKINIYQENTSQWLENTGLTWNGINMKPVYNYINGMLKISDANFQSGNSTKLFYYQDGTHKVRDNELCYNPPLLLSVGGNAVEVDQKFNASDYINEVTYNGAHQWYTADDGTLTETNWPLDDLYGFGRLFMYYVPDSNDVGGSTALFTDDGSNPTSLSITVPSYYTSAGISSWAGYYPTVQAARLIQDKLYFMWAGEATGSGTTATDTDMQSTMVAFSTGSIANVYFTFNYSWQGSYQVHSTTNDGNTLKRRRPPHFKIIIGKRAGIDIFDGGEPTAGEKKELSVANEEYTGMTNQKEAVVYTMDDELYNDETTLDSFENSELWPTTTFENLDSSQRSRRSNKTFTSVTSFDDGEIELTDDMIMEFETIWPGYNYEWDSGRYILQNHSDGNYGGVAVQPIYERIKFINLNVSFRSTNWTVLLNGLSASDSDKTKVDFTFSSPTTGSAFGWGERIFIAGVSSVNIFDEESEILSNPDTIGGTISNNLITSSYTISSGQSPDVTIYIGNEVFNDDYKKELKYYMKDSESDIWYLQFYVDLKKKKAYSTTSNFSTHGVLDNSNSNIVFSLPKEKMLNYNEVDSYESQTLVSQELKGSELVCDYKTSVVANNRLYVGNIRQDNIYYPDRMIKSPINKYNILPKSNFIDVAINDGDEITALEYFKDKILQFKKRKVFVINISGDYEFLEDTFDNIGVDAPYQVCKTSYGIAWANQAGLHLYDGSQIVNLIDNKIANQKENENITDNWWQIGSTSLGVKSDETNYTASVGYDPKQKDIVVKRGIKGGTAENSFSQLDGYIYNLVHQTWYMTHQAFNGISKNTYQNAMSNFANDSKGNLISYNYQESDTYDINDIMKWKHAQAGDDLMCAQRGIASADTNEKLMYLTTADFTFGNISTRKKIYKIYITYKADANTKILIKYGTNGSGVFSGTFKNASTNYSASTGLANTSNSWATAILKPSSSINNIYSFQLQFTDFANLANGSSSINFKINDISIVYRDKRVK